MLQATLNARLPVGQGKSFTVSFDNGRPVVDGNPLEWDIVKISESNFHIIHKNKSYTAELVQHDKANKTVILKINGSVHKIEKSSVVVKQVKNPKARVAPASKNTVQLKNGDKPVYVSQHKKTLNLKTLNKTNKNKVVRNHLSK